MREIPHTEKSTLRKCLRDGSDSYKQQRLLSLILLLEIYVEAVGIVLVREVFVDREAKVNRVGKGY